jgi:hypothetical protein
MVHGGRFVKRLRGCLGILLIFGLGLVVGGFIGFAGGWLALFHKVTKGGPAAVREVLYQRARDDLKLDYEQKEEIRAILKESSKELDEITASVRPAVERALARAEDRVRALLKPEQKAKFDSFIKEVRRKWSVLLTVEKPSELVPDASKPVPLEGEKKEEPR